MRSLLLIGLLLFIAACTPIDEEGRPIHTPEPEVVDLDEVDEQFLVIDKTYYSPPGAGAACTDSRCGAVVFKFETRDGTPVQAGVTVLQDGQLPLQNNPYSIGCRHDGVVLSVSDVTLPDGFYYDDDLPNYLVQVDCETSEASIISVS